MQENETLKGHYNTCLQENDQLKDSVELEKSLTQQLTAQVEDLMEKRLRWENKGTKNTATEIKKLKAE